MDYGLAAMQQTITDAKSKGRGNGSKLGYTSWKDGETKILRFLTNEVLTGQFADYVVCNDGKTQDFLIDPEKGDFVSKYGGKTKLYGSNELVEAKIAKKGVGIAVIRKEQADPTMPGRTEVLDDIIGVTPQGTSTQLPSRRFIIVKMGIGNFWKPLLAAAARCDGLCDRDWAITRVGGDKDTIYNPFPIEPVGEQQNALRQLQVVQSYYGYGRPWNAEDPQRLLYCPETLLEWVDYYSSEERAKFFLTPKAGAPAGGFAPPPVPGFAPPPVPGLQGYGQVAPVVSTATGVPVTHQVPVPNIAGQGYLPTPAPQPQAYVPPPVAQPEPQPNPLIAQQAASLNQLAAQVPPPFEPTPPGQPAFVAPTPPPVPAPAVQQPTAPLAQPQLPASLQQGPWGSSDDEAQAVPSGNTDWAQLSAQLMPGLATPSAQ
jgi:hypothetical protein